MGILIEITILEFFKTKKILPKVPTIVNFLDHKTPMVFSSVIYHKHSLSRKYVHTVFFVCLFVYFSLKISANYVAL